MSSEVEALLYRAFKPVEPPEVLYDRLETALARVSDAATGELADWELAAMRDPRNWARPATAVVVGSAAAAGLVIMRVRSRQPDQRKAASRFRDEVVRQAKKNLRPPGR